VGLQEHRSPQRQTGAPEVAHTAAKRCLTPRSTPRPAPAGAVSPACGLPASSQPGLTAPAGSVGVSSNVSPTEFFPADRRCIFLGRFPARYGPKVPLRALLSRLAGIRFSSSVGSNPSWRNRLYRLAASVSRYPALFGSATATFSAANQFLVCASRSLNSQPGRAPRQRGAASHQWSLSRTKEMPCSGRTASEDCSPLSACLSTGNAGQRVSEAARFRPGRVRGLTSSLKRRPTTAATAWPLPAIV
jgi:hypothetical protein